MITKPSCTIRTDHEYSRSATVDGVDVPLDTNGVGQVTLNDIGPHAVIATVSDVSGSDTASATVYVRDPNDTPPRQSWISPRRSPISR